MVRAALPLLLTTPLFDVPFNVILWQMILTEGERWGRMESIALASAFLFYNFYGRAIFFAFVVVPSQFRGFRGACVCRRWCRQQEHGGSMSMFPWEDEEVIHLYDSLREDKHRHH